VRDREIEFPCVPPTLSPAYDYNILNIDGVKREYELIDVL
jgi:hypothetical protein